ncbi:hypothetical protein [Thermoflavimicrobium daqui]|uniref:Uncharacterized protein n=1 Tax=Thermoflavimicrobium daqui TaxID=2137476 RepID=A0A364K4X0_9BACL|nr:hypothetical protein [Thermoflavimicrobium daqui]RAL24428.1 hypothetical protein DL897_08875 [Thermoflavimicrobium daqui]
MLELLIPIITLIGLFLCIFLTYHFFEEGKKRNSKLNIFLGVIFLLATIGILAYKIYWSFIR